MRHEYLKFLAATLLVCGCVKSQAEGEDVLSVLKPNQADAAVMESVVYDEHEWITYKKATLLIWQGGAQSAMAQAYLRRKGNKNNIYKSLAALTDFYSTPGLRKELEATGMSPQTYAIWDKGLLYYRTCMLLAKKMTEGAARSSLSSPHDTNYKFVLDHEDEINNFLNEITSIASEGATGDDEK